MKNYLKVKFTLLCLICSVLFEMKAQTITPDSNPSISGTVCPTISTGYSVSIPSGFANCSILWTPTNGSLASPNGNRTVSINWDDTPGATATLTCKFTNCGNSNDNTTATWSALILSVKGQNFDAYGNSVTIDYCTTNSVTINVPHMWVQGTGGVAQPPLQEVIYSWTLPSGWTTNGGLNTTVNSITIYPTHCAVSGTGMVSVKGNIIDRCGSAELSNAATISLNGARPVVSLVIPQGYTGSTACNTTPVTFTADLSPSLSCASSYSWTKPSSWTLVGQSGNQVTLQPSGGPDDATTGSISVAVTFSCGTTITSGNYTPPYTPPAIAGPDPFCSSGTYSIQGAPNTVSWTSSNTSALTIDANGVGTRHGNSSTTISATFAGGCTAPISPKPIWVGIPVYWSITLDGTSPQWYSDCNTGSIPFTVGPDPHILETTLGGSSSTTFTLNDPSGTIVAIALTPTRYSFSTKRTDISFSITLSSSNSCGTATQCIYFSNQGTCTLPQYTSITVDGGSANYSADCSSGANSFSVGTHNLTALTSGSTSTTFSLSVFSGTGVSGHTVSSTQYSFTTNNTTAQFQIRLSTTNTCGTTIQCLFFCNGSCVYPAGPIQTSQAKMSAYPNPSSSTLTVQVSDSLENNSLDQPYQLHLFNKFGTNVFSIESNEKVLEIPVGNLPPDIYYLHFRHQDAVLERKIVIKR